MMLLYIGNNFFPKPPARFLYQDVNRQVLNFKVFKRNIRFYCAQQKLDWLRIPKLAYACGSSSVSKTTDRISSIKVSNDNFICVQGNSIKKYSKIFTRHSYFHGLKLAKCHLLWLRSIVKLIFSKSTGWISATKISQDSFKFSDGDAEKYLGPRTLLRSPDNSILPRIAEINGGIDIRGQPLKIRLKTPFSFFFNYLQKLIKFL